MLHTTLMEKLFKDLASETKNNSWPVNMFELTTLEGDPNLRKKPFADVLRNECF